MIFYILLCLIFSPFIFFVVSLILTHDAEEAFLSGFIGLLAATIPGFAVFTSWSCHADDLAVIKEQTRVISVYEQQKEELTKTLNTFQYPESSLLNADSPVASIVLGLSDAEKMLADARKIEAEAYKSIESRKIGPMSGVVNFVGDYK